MVTKELLDKLVAFAETAPHAFIGKQITVEQDLSLVKDNFDRHFSASAKFTFTLSDFMIRFSGNKLMFMGEDSNYEIHGDTLIEFSDLGDGSYLFMEALSERIYRRSAIRFH